MKKKGLIIASLLVLVMSVVFLGCPPPEDETNDPTVPADVLAKLKTFGFTPTSLPVPEGGSYDNYAQPVVETEEDGEYYIKKTFYIMWDKCTTDIMTEYKSAWGSNKAQIKLARNFEASDEFNLKNIGTGISGTVYFTEAGGTDNGVTIKANSIVFIAQETNWSPKPAN